MIKLDPKTTALVLIDLQAGILAMDTKPRPSAEVLAGAKTTASRFRAAGAAVILVHVDFGPSFELAPPGIIDATMQRPERAPDNWSTLDAELVQAGDIIVTKRQWGAFHGTDLDLQLRRRGIDTIVLGGIATNFGVESTLRHGWEHGYDMIAAEDICTGISAELHDMAFRHVFPRISRVVQTTELAFD